MTLTPHPYGLMAEQAASGSAFENAVMALSPVAAYLFRDTDFSAQIEDSSGNGYHMTKQKVTASRGAALRVTHPGGILLSGITNWTTNGIHYSNASGGLDVVLGGVSSLSLVIGMNYLTRGTGNDFLLFSMGTEGTTDYVLAVDLETTNPNEFWVLCVTDVFNKFAFDAAGLLAEPICYTYRLADNGSSMDVLLDRINVDTDTQVVSSTASGSVLSDVDRTCFIGGRNNTNTSGYGTAIVDHLSIFTPALSIAQLDNLRLLYQNEMA